MEARQGGIKQILKMVGGDGEYSYAANSSRQRKRIVMTKSILENVIEQMYRSTLLLERITIVDLGCSSGPNALLVISQVLDVISKLHEQSSKEETVPEIQFVLNDLPGNDFNSLFQSLGEFKEKIKEERGNLLIPYYIAAVPGSFHGRILPSSTVHLFHSSSSLHWLSQVPKELESAQGISQNKKNICFTMASPPMIVKAYRKQFRRDFSIFLKSRFEELSVGGGALLTFPGREDVDGDALIHICELFDDSLNEMAEEGIISKAKLDALYVPIYVPLLEEVKSIILSESSFHIEQAQLLSSKWLEHYDKVELDMLRDGKKIANSLRAGTESLFADNFGDAILDELFERVAQRISKSILEEKLTDCNVALIVLVLKKNTPR